MSLLPFGSTPAKSRVEHNGTLVAARKFINLIDGGGVTFTVTDNVAQNRVDVSAVASATDSIVPTTMTADFSVPDRRQQFAPRRITVGVGLRLSVGIDAALVTTG